MRHIPAPGLRQRRMKEISLVCAVFLAACGADPAAGPKSPDANPTVLDEVRITKTDPATLPDLFRAASDRLLRGENAEAAKELDHIVAVDPTGPTAAPSLFNAGVAYSGLGDLAKAADRYRASAELDPEAPTAKTAWIRTSRIDAYLERWDDLLLVSEKILARRDLSTLEQLEGMGGKGLALVFMNRIPEAYDVLVQARNIIEDKKLGIAGPPPLELAQVSFAMGEVKRIKSEAIVFVPVPPDFGATLEDRCTGLLDAQSAYTDAMRSMDAHWSAMAGYRVGQLYQKLHEDVMKAPPPSVASTIRQQQLWEGAMRLRYRVLLEKGLAMMKGTVDLGERTGEASPWIARAKESKKELELALEAEKAALAKLPFTEAEIQAALDDLKKKKQPPKP
ncbi:MAG TPA: tetratricopeptide repeat protein [Polyangiaceae bacterium]|nr:tetratricopeptide repeat protein [Polyangiaceae bacterium]